ISKRDWSSDVCSSDLALYKGEELCVCDIANIIGVTVANASHHLRTLHKQGVEKFRKEGKLSFYSLDDEHVEQLFVIGLTHMKEEIGRASCREGVRSER